MIVVPMMCGKHHSQKVVPGDSSEERKTVQNQSACICLRHDKCAAFGVEERRDEIDFLVETCRIFAFNLSPQA